MVFGSLTGTVGDEGVVSTRYVISQDSQNGGFIDVSRETTR